MRKYPVIIALLIAIPFIQPIHAASNKNLQLRIDRLERMLENNSQYQLLAKIKQLKEENRELRGLVEEQSNLIKKLERRIHSLYSDMDRRLVAVETDTSKILSGQRILPDTDLSDSTKATSVEDKTEQPKADETNQGKQIASSKDKQFNQSKPETNETASSTLNNDNKASKLLAEKQYEEQQAYQKAFEQLKALRYSKAQKSFSEFLSQYPDGRYAHIAQYWLAESNYAQRKFKLAITDYQRLLEKYKTSPKKAEAYLKIAYCHYELGNKKKTRETLNTLIKRFPNTTESGQAKRLLKRL